MVFFYKNYIVYYNVYHNYFGVKSMRISSFVLVGRWLVSYVHGHLCPYHNGLRLFIIVLQELHCIVFVFL